LQGLQGLQGCLGFREETGTGTSWRVIAIAGIAGIVVASRPCNVCRPYRRVREK